MKLMSFVRSRGLAAAVLTVAALAGAGAAHARSDVVWSVGIHAAPGVTVGLGNARPIYAPAPVYLAPQPIYVQPAPVYYAQPAPVYSVRPAPLVYGPPVYYGPSRGYRHGHRHHRHWR